MITALPSVQDTDDLYYDASRKRIYMAGGEGFSYVFQQKDPDHFELLSKIPTASGAGTPDTLGKERRISTGSFWPFRLVQNMVLNNGFSPYTTEITIKS